MPLLRILTLLLLASLLAAAPASAAFQTPPLDPTELEAFFDQLIPTLLDQYHIPGATLAVVQQGELSLAKSYGYADLEQGRLVDPRQTLFRIGSVAKLVTWTAVMQLVEQGRLDLHEDVNTYLDFTIPDTFLAPITLYHLLTHTPGFEDMGEGLFLLDEDELLPLGDYLRLHLPNRVFQPGHVRAYSNYGAALAGYIVERVSGQSFDDYVEQHIFVPLGMQRSTLRQPVPPELAADLAGGYNFHEGQYLRGQFLFVGPYPAGSMSAPAADLAPFMIAHLENGRYGEAEILQPATVLEMQRRRFEVDPRLDGMAYGFIERTTNGRHILHHEGSTFQFNSGLYLLPVENLGLFISFNSLGGAAALKPFLQAFMDRFYPAPAPAPLNPPPNAAQHIAVFSGEYQLARADFSSPGKILNLLGAQVSASPEGHLLLMVEGRTETYTELEPGLFRHRDRAELLLFHDGADGNIWLSLDGSPAFASFTATSAFRAPWYATLAFSGLLLLLSLVLFLLTSLVYGLAAVRNRRRGLKYPAPVYIGRGLVLAFSLLLLIFLVGFIAILVDIDPVYGVPRALLVVPPALNLVLLIPWLLAAVALGMFVISLLAWLDKANLGRPFTSLFGRSHYTFLTFLAFAVLGWMIYWNLLQF